MGTQLFEVDAGLKSTEIIHEVLAEVLELKLEAGTIVPMLTTHFGIIDNIKQLKISIFEMRG